MLTMAKEKEKKRKEKKLKKNEQDKEEKNRRKRLNWGQKEGNSKLHLPHSEPPNFQPSPPTFAIRII